MPAINIKLEMDPANILLLLSCCLYQYKANIIRLYVKFTSAEKEEKNSYFSRKESPRPLLLLSVLPEERTFTLTGGGVTPSLQRDTWNKPVAVHSKPAEPCWASRRKRPRVMLNSLGSHITAYTLKGPVCKI